MVQAMLEPGLRNVLVGLLLLFGCNHFMIDPRQRSILLNGTGFKQDEVGVITMKELIENHEMPSEFAKQLERKVYADYEATTFIDVSDELDATPKQVVKMLEQADNLELVTVLKVAPNTNCSTIVERKIKPADDRIKFMYVCKQDDTNDFGLVFNESRYEKFNSFEDRFEELEYFWKLRESNSDGLASELVPKTTERDSSLLSQHESSQNQCTTPKPCQVADPETSCFELFSSMFFGASTILMICNCLWNRLWK